MASGVKALRRKAHTLAHDGNNKGVGRYCGSAVSAILFGHELLRVSPMEVRHQTATFITPKGKQRREYEHQQYRHCSMRCGRVSELRVHCCFHLSRSRFQELSSPKTMKPETCEIDSSLPKKRRRSKKVEYPHPTYLDLSPGGILRTSVKKSSRPTTNPMNDVMIATSEKTAINGDKSVPTPSSTCAPCLNACYCFGARYGEGRGGVCTTVMFRVPLLLDL